MTKTGTTIPVQGFQEDQMGPPKFISMLRARAQSTTFKGQKAKKKVATHHENTEIPNRCFVHLYKLYQSKCPVHRPDHAFYLQPHKPPRRNAATTPIGHVTLAATVGRLMTFQENYIYFI